MRRPAQKVAAGRNTKKLWLERAKLERPKANRGTFLAVELGVKWLLGAQDEGLPVMVRAPGGGSVVKSGEEVAEDHGLVTLGWVGLGERPTRVLMGCEGD